MNFLLLLIVLVLYLRQNRLIEVEKKQQAALSQSEELMSAFILEMKEENEQFISKLKTVQEWKSQPNSVQTTERKSGLDIKENPLSNEVYSELLAAKAYKEPSAEQILEPKVSEDLSFEDHVLLLYSKGFSIEDIAKKLSKGKTEIELLLKFNKRQ